MTHKTAPARLGEESCFFQRSNWPLNVTDKITLSHPLRHAWIPRPQALALYKEPVEKLEESVQKSTKKMKGTRKG